MTTNKKDKPEKRTLADSIGLKKNTDYRIYPRCPVCNHTQVDMSRMETVGDEGRFENYMECSNCGYTGKSETFMHPYPNDENHIVTHEEIREELSLWSRSARSKMYLYIGQQEAREHNSNYRIRQLEILVKYYESLAMIDPVSRKIIDHKRLEAGLVNEKK